MILKSERPSEKRWADGGGGANLQLPRSSGQGRALHVANFATMDEDLIPHAVAGDTACIIRPDRDEEPPAGDTAAELERAPRREAVPGLLQYQELPGHPARVGAAAEFISREVVRVVHD